MFKRLTIVVRLTATVSMNVRRVTLGEWENSLPATGTEVFHSPEVLRVVDEYATGELRLYVGYRGEQPVGFLPAFVRELAGVRAVLSPIPGFSLSRMGPIVASNSPKQRKRERVNRTFTEQLLETLREGSLLTLVAMVFSTEYVDPRPYLRDGFDVVPRFTYALDLRETDAESVLKGFTRDLRSEIRKLEDTDLDVTVGGAADAVRVYDDYCERFAEQGAEFPTPRAYTREIVAALGDRARVYTAASPDGSFLGGVSVLYSGETAYFWQGGMRADYDGLSVNSLLHWRIVEDILTDPELDSIERYDLGRAAVERLGRYKSKFNPELVPYYEVRSSKLLWVAKKLYEFVTY